MTDIDAIKQEIQDMESRMDHLRDLLYYRRLEKKKLKAKIRRRKLKLKKLLKDLNL